jgi:23S rRNA U2552 (ribose-2'-O)-methylase RlmE/FtsJ
MKLAEIYSKYSYPGGWGDKGTAHSYIDIYAKEMNKTDDIDLLEIGVKRGHSIKMWEEYFTNSRIYGIDIDLSELEFDCKNVHICDGTSRLQIDSLFDKQQFDYVVDDGSHHTKDQIRSFDILWPRIKSGGKYFIEDVAGDRALEQISKYMKEHGIWHIVFDNRHLKNLFDDIIVMVENA